MSLWSVEAQHGGELGDVVLHSEARVTSPGNAGEAPELTVFQLRKRGEGGGGEEGRAVLLWRSRAR